MGGLINIYFSQFWRLRSLSSWHCQMQRLMRAGFLFQERLASLLASRDRRGEGAFWVFVRAHRNHQGSTHMTQSPLKGPTLQIPSYWRLRFQSMNLGGTQIFNLKQKLTLWVHPNSRKKPISNILMEIIEHSMIILCED